MSAHRYAAAAMIAAALLLTASCGFESPAPAETTAAASTSQSTERRANPDTKPDLAPTDATPPTANAPAPPPAEPAPTEWVMPDLVGLNLQDAQNAIQALTDNAIFYTSSHDASGQGRSQLLDANWMVCSQNVAAGGSISASTAIDFGAVKLDEVCP